jgi:hypothetical protein
MNVCPDCGNKRCPKAANHARWQCSGSNETGQVGVPVNAWPFAPGDVVRDSGEDGDDAAWLDAAPQRTVVVDSQGTEWTRLGDGWFIADPPVRASRWASLNLNETYGPLSVVSVGKDVAHAARRAAPATPAVGVRTSEGATGAQIAAHMTQPDPDGGVEFTDEEWAAFRGEAPGGASEVGLGDALRAIIPATYTDDGYFGVTALEIGEFAERADALERERDDARREIEHLRGQGRESDGFRTLMGQRNEARTDVDRLNDENTRQSEMIGRVRDLAAELTFKGKGEPDDMPDEFELVRDEVAYMIRKRLGDAK